MDETEFSSPELKKADRIRKSVKELNKLNNLLKSNFRNYQDLANILSRQFNAEDIDVGKIYDMKQALAIDALEGKLLETNIVNKSHPYDRQHVKVYRQFVDNYIARANGVTLGDIHRQLTDDYRDFVNGLTTPPSQAQ